MACGKYDDMLYMEHPTSGVHPRMAPEDRAAQFSPFAALTGYDEAVKETARRTGERIHLDEYEKAELDHRLHVLQSRTEIASREVSVTYFVPDLRKEGGEYVTVKGRFRKADVYAKVLLMEDGTEIPLKEIVRIEGEDFG